MKFLKSFFRLFFRGLLRREYSFLELYSMMIMGALIAHQHEYIGLALVIAASVITFFTNRYSRTLND